jgi:hypothetical protein
MGRLFPLKINIYNMKNFIVKITHWINNVLVTVKKYFNCLEEAILESKLWKGLVKVYNHLGEVLHSCKNIDGNTYA